MHDFLLAKEIIDELKKIARKKDFSKVKKVHLEIGMVTLAHDGFPEHPEEIDLENLRFGIENIAKGTTFEKTDFLIKKTAGENWKITDIEVE